MISLGADLTRRDSNGFTALDAALRYARQLIPQFHYGERRYLDNRQLTPELDEDLMRVFRLIIASAPEITWKHLYIRPEETLLLQYLTRNGSPRCEEAKCGLA